MTIHQTIFQRRKQLGLTQEQVAEYLGVTAPAVNKWEKGNTCPDIALLSPLARLLKIDLNTLLGFHQDLTAQEVELFCSQVRQTAASQGFEAGFALAQEKVFAYPNCDSLVYNLALLLQSLLFSAGLDEKNATGFWEAIHAWYQRLTESENDAIRNSANYLLASQAISKRQFETAQTHLDQMPNRNDTPDKRMLQAALYLQQSRAQEAAKLLEQTLMAAVADVQTLLYQLINADLALGELDAAAQVAERVAMFTDTFSLSPYGKFVARFQIAAARKDPVQTTAILGDMLDSLKCVWDPRASFLYSHIPSNGAGISTARMIQPLLNQLKTSDEFAFLQNDAEFQTLLAEFGSNLS